MNKIQLYNKIKFYYEDRFDSKNIEMYKRIIEELLKYDKSLNKVIQSLYGDYEEIFNALHIYLLEQKKDIRFFYRLLEKYHYHFFHTLLWCITDICSVKYEKTEKYLINLYVRSPLINQIKKENNTYKIDSSLGTIEFQKASQYFQNLHNSYLKNLVISRNLSGYCHESTLVLVKHLKDSLAFTALCKQAFIGQYYHSVTVHQNCCIDINSGSVIPINQFQRLTSATILEKISHSKIDKRTQPYAKYGSELLYNTLHHQLQKLKIKRKELF